SWRLVSGSPDSTKCTWDARTGQLVGQSTKEHMHGAKSVTYSPDGACIVSGSIDSTICITDAHTRRPLGLPLGGHTDAVYSVAYSPDGAYIVSGSWDKTIRVWNAHTHYPVGQPLTGHTSEVNSVAFSPDGVYIVSGSDDTTVRVWSMKLVLPMDDVSQLDDGQSKVVHTQSATSKPRILCNLSCQIDCPHMDWTLNYDGWIVFNEDKLIWVPPDLWKVLVPPRNTALMTRRGFLHLDLGRNKLGKHWRENFQPCRLSSSD
ncbi:hypothetical protein FRC12_024469, partial [Ceratobasidium sp. 428]